MKNDSIIEEIHQIREQYAEKLAFDLDAMFADLKRQEKQTECLEVEFKQSDDNLVLIGIGLRASRGNITTMLLKYARIKDDGTIDRDYPIEIKTGTEPESGLEVYAESEELDTERRIFLLQ